MATVVASKTHIDQEEAGETTLELIALRYTGSHSCLAVSNHLNNEGQWPGSAALNGREGEPGPWYFGLVPDGGLGYLESRSDLDILYADQREAFAEALLDQRRLPRNAFGRGADRDLQDRMFDTLGLEPTVDGGPIRDQLRALAGRDESTDADDEGEPDKSLVETLVDADEGYTRHELGDACQELREDADEFNLQEHASKRERAEFVAQFDAEERANALPDNGGED